MTWRPGQAETPHGARTLGALIPSPLELKPEPPLPPPWNEWRVQIHGSLSHLHPCFLVETTGIPQKRKAGSQG